jgi:hypothetical protein
MSLGFMSKDGYREMPVSAWNEPLKPKDRISEFVQLCEYMRRNLPNLRAAIFSIRLTKNELKTAIRSPQKQSWLQAIKQLGIREFELDLLIIDNKQSHGSERFTEPEHNGWMTWQTLDYVIAKEQKPSEKYSRLLTQHLTPEVPDLGLTDDLEGDLGFNKLFARPLEDLEHDLNLNWLFYPGGMMGEEGT